MEGFDHKVANIDLHEWGRKEIDLAQIEMPGLMACRTEFGSKGTHALKGAQISGSLHMTI
jgi:adenosylhomocysteinase